MNVRRTALVGAVVAVVLSSAPVHAGDEQADRKQVQQQFEKYLSSVKGADLVLASEVWSQTADVVAVTPFGQKSLTRHHKQHLAVFVWAFTAVRQPVLAGTGYWTINQ